MPTENRMGWNHEIESFAKIYMFQVGKVVYDWATGIINREGKVIDKIDEEIIETEKEIREKTELGKKLDNEIRELDKKQSKTRLQWQKLIDDASRLKNVANKYIIEKMKLEKMDKDSREYRELEKRLKGFESKYIQWKETVVKADQKKEEYQEIYAQYVEAKGREKNHYIGGLSLLQYVGTPLRAKLERLRETKKLLEGAIAVNMEKHRDELAKAFSDPKAIRNVSGMIINTFDKALQGNLNSDEFSEDELLQFMEEAFQNSSQDELKRFNFLRTLAKDKKNYTTIAIDGKPVKVFDMDKISTEEMIQVFSAFFRQSIDMSVRITLEKMKKKRRYFVREQVQNDDDDEYSLYDTAPSDDLPDTDGRTRKKRELKEDEIVDKNTKNLWKEVEIYLNQNTDKIADVVNNALQRQLPQNAYFRKIGPEKARNELRPVIKNIIRSCGNEIRNGSIMASTKLRNFVKTALGGVEDGAIFNIIYTIIRAALEYYISSCLGKNILEHIKKVRRDEATFEINFLRALEKRKDMSKQALRDYNMVKYASRTHRIAEVISSEIEYDDPEEIIERLDCENADEDVQSNYQMDRKTDFLLENESFPDNVGKYNNQLGGQPKHVPGLYGA